MEPCSNTSQTTEREDKEDELMESSSEKQAVCNGIFQRRGFIESYIKFRDKTSISVYVVPCNFPEM